MEQETQSEKLRIRANHQNERRRRRRRRDSHLSSVSDTGLEGLPAGEVKGVPVSVSLELSRWLLSREMRLELPPLELRFNSAMLCGGRHAEVGRSVWKQKQRRRRGSRW